MKINALPKNEMTISLDESKIDNLHNEVKISKRILLINNLTNRMIDTKKFINELRQEIRDNRKAIEGLGWDLSWEKSKKIIKEKTANQIEIEDEIAALKDDNSWKRDMISEMKTHFTELKNRLNNLGV
jgi:chromosome segregation ATPase